MANRTSPERTSAETPWIDPSVGPQADPDPTSDEIAVLGQSLADLRPSLTPPQDAHVEEILHGKKVAKYNQNHDDRGRFASAPGSGSKDAHLNYRPDPAAPAEGEWVRGPDPTGFYPNGVATGWRQAHGALVEDALHSWKGDPVEMSLHMQRIKRGEPTLGAGSGKRMDMQAAALLYEMNHNARPNSVRLYRGADSKPTQFRSWSESRSIARQFQRRSEGQVFSLAPGAGQGLRVADYIRSGLDQAEREWIIDSKSTTF